MINTSVCRCEKCLELAHSRFKHDTIIAGYRQLEDELSEKIIAGIKPHKTQCECLQNYLKAIEKYEDWKQRNSIVEKLQATPQKFIISGVVNRPNKSPVFIISGIKPKKECPCIENFRNQQAEIERLKRMPKKLFGLEYVISGVKETPEGNVFIVSGVHNGKKCKCLQLYNTFMKKHGACLKLTELYEEKVKMDLEEHMSEFDADEKVSSDEENQEKPKEETTETNVITNTPCIENCEIVDPIQEQLVQKESEGKPPIIETNLIVDDDNEQPEEVCERCEPKEDKVIEEVELKRFVILDKFPKSKKAQYEVLKVC